MNYIAVYFSPTGTFEKSAVSIIEALAEGKEFDRIDLTPYGNGNTEKIFSAGRIKQG